MSEHKESSGREAERLDHATGAVLELSQHMYAGRHTWPQYRENECLILMCRSPFANEFTPINRRNAPSTVSTQQGTETAAAEEPRRKRARTAPVNMLVADYLGIDADPRPKGTVGLEHPLAVTSKPTKRKRASRVTTPGLIKSTTEASRRRGGVSDVRIIGKMPVVKVRCWSCVLISTFML